MKREAKITILKSFSEHLSKFYPELENTFVCPTCLIHIPCEERSEISEAHIMPEAVDGWQTTFICKNCNSTFGSKQDRWLGEHLHMEKNDFDVLEANNVRSFDINGRRFNGKIDADHRKGVSIYIDLSRSAPDGMDFLENAKVSGEMNLRIRPEIMRKRNELRVGYLTAAYLAWFKAIGYSWALQSHLDVIREQISNPSEEIIKERYFFLSDRSFVNGAAIMIIKFQDMYMPAVIMGKRVTILPTPSISLHQFHQRVEEGGVFESECYHFLTVNESLGWDGPLCFLFGSNYINCPDIAFNEPDSGTYVYYEDFDSEPQQMFPTDESVIDEIKRENSSKVLSKSLGKITRPTTETGRDS